MIKLTITIGERLVFYENESTEESANDLSWHIIKNGYRRKIKDGSYEYFPSYRISHIKTERE